MANRLAEETSPYLLQHKDNPVDWQPWGPEALGAGGEGGQADPALDRVLRLPLVPCDGARVLRGPGDRRLYERAFRADQGRPRGTTRRRRHLHGGGPGDDRAGWLAADRFPRPRGRPVLRRHLLPTGTAPGPAELQAGDGGDRRRLSDPAGGAARGLGPDQGVARHDCPRPAVRAATRPIAPGRRGQRLPGRPRPGQRRLRRRAQVPAGERARVPARSGPDGAGRPDARQDDARRHLRPARRRIRPLLGGRELARPPLREDALRQRAARARSISTAGR